MVEVVQVVYILHGLVRLVYVISVVGWSVWSRCSRWFLVIQVVQVVRMISLDDKHSENIWFSWSKPSNYRFSGVVHSSLHLKNFDFTKKKYHHC